MKKYGLYKHENCSDVLIDVLRIIFIPEKKGYKVKVNWINCVNKENLFPIGVSEEIFIPKEKIKEWFLYNE